MSEGLIEQLLDWNIDGPVARSFGAQRLCKEAADRIEALDRELRELRDHCEAMEVEHRQAIEAMQAAEADKARLSEALREALAANERDRTEIIIAVNALTDAFARRDWLIRGGRGSYEWDDDRFRDEFRDAMEEFQPHIDQLRKIGADRTNCPKTQAEVMVARATLAGSGSGWRTMDSAPKDRLVLLAAEFVPGDWRIKVGGWREDLGRWEVFGASWTPTRWMPLPAAPQQGGE